MPSSSPSHPPADILLDETSHINLRPLSSSPTPPTTINSDPIHPDMGPSPDFPLLKSTSLYLDNQYSHSIPLDDPNNPIIPNTLDSEHPPQNPPTQKKKSSRASKAERLAAEQAIWLRDKFDLPPHENLIATFSAALVRHILLQGRIYITTSSLCFYAKIFGKITKEHYPFSSISRVKKRRGGFVANAIKLYFVDQDATPVIIASLNHRERACRIIHDRIQEINPQLPCDDDGASGASAGHDSEDKSNEGDDFCIRPNEDADLDHHPAAPNSVSVSAATNALPAGIRNAESDTMSEMSSRKSSEIERMAKSDTPPHADPSPQLVWKTPDDLEDRVHGKEFEKKVERARGVLNAPVTEVFNMLFIGDWLKQYHDACGNREFSSTPWYRESDGFMTRDVTFRKPLGYKIGPKETRVKETQRYSFTSCGGVVVELEGQNLDAPYGDYFVVESYHELSPCEGGTKCLFVSSLAVHFKKSTILRGKIESGALAETKIAYQRVITLAGEYVDEQMAGKVKASRGLPPLQKKREGSNAQVVVQSENRTSGQGLGVGQGQRQGRSEMCVGAGSSREQVGRQCGAAVSATAAPAAAPAAAVGTVGGVGMARPSGEGVMVNKTSIEVRDSMHSKWFKILGVGALYLLCVLMFAVMILLYRMQSNIDALEKVVYKQHQQLIGKCS